MIAAIGRADRAADLDVELAIDLITGSVLNRLFFSDLPVDEEVLAKVLDVVLAGIGAPAEEQSFAKQLVADAALSRETRPTTDERRATAERMAEAEVLGR